MKLNEILSVLLEYKREITATKLGPALFQAFNKEGRSYIQRYLGSNQVPDEATTIDLILGKIESADPTPNKQYSQWMAQTYSRGGYHLEDITSRISDALEKFFKLNQKKKIPSPQNDINRYKSFQEFETFIETLPNIEEKSTVDKGDATEYYRDEYMRIIIPKDQSAACYYGQGTRWCTAAKKDNYFKDYSSRGPLYIIIPTNPAYTGEKYQLHFETNSYMNEKDKRVEPYDLTNRFPNISKAFSAQIEKFNLIDLKYTKEQLELGYKKIKLKWKETLTKKIQNSVDDIEQDFLGKMKYIKDIPFDRASLAQAFSSELRNSSSNLLDFLFKHAQRFKYRDWTDSEKSFDATTAASIYWIYHSEFKKELLSKLSKYDNDDERRRNETFYKNISNSAERAIGQELAVLVKETFIPMVEQGIQTTSK